MEKRVGETPLQALGRLRLERGIEDDIPLSYAGRLDPMASGQLLVLEGAECADRARYLGLDKEYEVEVLLGAFSDTGDVLGIVRATELPLISHASLEQAARSLMGPYDAPYPAFSSRTVSGKPLFMWALENRLDEIVLPRQRGRVDELEILDITRPGTADLAARVTELLSLAPRTGDPRPGRHFRVDEAQASWDQFLAGPAASLQVVQIRVLAGAGTYMRTLADDLARLVGTRGLALAIHRTRILTDQARTKSAAT